MLSVEITEIMEVMVEEVHPGQKIGAFSENMFEVTTESICRPIFKCRLAPKHEHYFPKEYILIDIEQLAVDSFARELLLKYVQSVRDEGKHTREHNKLDGLLSAVLAVIGSKTE